jgi:hypothetical protein
MRLRDPALEERAQQGGAETEDGGQKFRVAYALSSLQLPAQLVPVDGGERKEVVSCMEHGGRPAVRSVTPHT